MSYSMVKVKGHKDTELYYPEIQNIVKNKNKPIDSNVIEKIAYEWVEDICKRFKQKTASLGKEYRESGLEVGAEITGDKKETLFHVIKHRLTNYCKIRRMGNKGLREQGFIYDNFLGEYQITLGERKFVVKISNEPVHVLTRTTGRDGFSCEEVYNGYWTGPFHDIALRNPTAYLLDMEGNFYGRLNLRWTGNPKDSDIGIDPNIYPMNFDYVRARKMLMGDVRMLHLALFTLFASSGLGWYKTETTPYIYRGHSDTTPSGHVKLPFKGIYHTNNSDIQDYVIQLLQMDFIKL